MRIFWILLTLVAAAGALFVFTAAPAGKTPGTTPAPSVQGGNSVQAESTRATPPPSTQASPSVSAPQSPDAAMPASVSPAALPVQPAATTASPVSVADNPVVATAESKLTSPASATPEHAKPEVATPSAEVKASSGKSGGTEAFAPLEPINGYTVLAPSAERKPDGSILLDGKFVVLGEGSKENPYVVTWEILTSADADFDPQAGKKQIPYRIAMLHDRYVKLGGFIAFPMNMQQPKELLLMLNQWDGCCIGVPPTPYDAIEVVLDKTVEGEDRFATTGSLLGKFQVKPYVVGDWLVGLYVMDRGDFKAGFGGGSGS
jgi:hypothetical protein